MTVTYVVKNDLIIKARSCILCVVVTVVPTLSHRSVACGLREACAHVAAAGSRSGPGRTRGSERRPRVKNGTARSPCPASTGFKCRRPKGALPAPWNTVPRCYGAFSASSTTDPEVLSFWVKLEAENAFYKHVVNKMIKTVKM